MSSQTDFLEIEPDGTPRVRGRAMQDALRRLAGSYRLALSPPGFVLFQSDAGHEVGRRQPAQVLMAGQIVTATTIIEVISIIATAGWRGELNVQGSDSLRAMFFDQGALKHARSDQNDDRLGELLLRAGVLSREQLEALLYEYTPHRRFGQLVVERGLLDQEELFEHLQRQIAQVFFAALAVRDGTYFFLVPDEFGTPPPTTAHIPVQPLLMEGVQRIDEMALFRERIPSLAVCPEAQSSFEGHSIDPRAGKVLVLCNGKRTILDIARESGLDEFEATKAIYHLLQQGRVSLRTGPAVEYEAALKLVNQFNDVMRDIFVAVATYGGIDKTRATLATWLQGGEYGSIFGTEVDVDGTIDADEVVQALREKQLEHPLEMLHQALHQLAAFAMFAATTSLPREQEMMLAREVNRRIKGIRI